MIHKLLSANEAMETQVRQRTQQLEEANQELDRQARSDPLTGLLNRRGFDAQMNHDLALARRSGRPCRSSRWMWTTSNASMTRMAAMWATRYCSGWPPHWPRGCASPTHGALAGR